MAKKLGKFLLFTATVGAAAAAAAYYLQKKDLLHFADRDDDDDFDDFGEDSEEESETSRNYVQLNPSSNPEEVVSDAEASATETEASGAEAAASAAEAEDVSAKEDSFTPLSENAPRATDKKSEETVEEFFDEEDSTETASPSENEN